MRAPHRRIPSYARIAVAVAGAFGALPQAMPGTLTIANEPLGTGVSTIKPNVMFILDDSGSMFSDYMPDYVNDSWSPSNGTTASCFDSGDDDSNAISGNPDTCDLGDPPFMSPDLNTMYYSPEILYSPGKNFNGTDMNTQNSANTTAWSSVRTDMYNVVNTNQEGNSNTYVNLVTGYPDRVWCKTTSDTAGSGNCKTNSGGYTYPDDTYKRTPGSGSKYVYGSPYYYRIKTARYCSDAARTSCRSGNDISASTDIYEAVEYCTDSELTTCAAGSGVTGAHVFSGLRYCNNANLLDTGTTSGVANGCQRKKIGTYIYPKHLGKVKSGSGVIAAMQNTGSITFTSVAASGGTITSITVGATTVYTGTLTYLAGTTPTQVASDVATRISNGFTATASGPTVNITKTAAGASGSGDAITFSSGSSGTTGAKATLTLANITAAGGARTIATLTVNGTNILCTGPSSNTSYLNGVTAQSNGTIIATSGWTSNKANSSLLTALAARIDACTGSNGGYSATKSGSDLIINAPTSLGDTVNTRTVSISGTNVATSNGFTFRAFAGGASTTNIKGSTTSMTGGADATSGTFNVRVGVGNVARTDIISANNTYTKYSARTDCIGASCTYQEEMTNFANWYTYYRTRMKTMKTAAGRAFASLDETFRVGLITINPAQTGTFSDKYLKIADFTTTVGGHKSNWYDKLYAQTTGSSTPLREALSRVGWIYAGKFGTGLTSSIASTDDPVTTSCQPNFAILSTDGYWNGNQGQDLEGVAMGNQDNVDSGYSKRSDGAYDGNLLPNTLAGSGAGGKGTLADVAMYYYKTDLRDDVTHSWVTGGVWGAAIRTNNVPATTRDPNQAQHMVTFTIGLGLDGELSYTSDYETATSGDFFSIKQGTKNWPSPNANRPSALDDLWHAAVNGRGVFFSASNPSAIATGLAETLSAVQQRVGAGAAAATSNLQPVAGDNFAFTAEYQTGDWFGDLKARTIDLSTGTVSAVVLWSAQTKLTEKDHFDRNIYTYDAADTGVSGNRLRDMCWTGAVHANCTDLDATSGLAGIQVSEQAYFNPSTLVQWPYGGDVIRQTAVDGEKLLNFVRGDKTYEDTGSSSATDLFRSREKILGDVVNAQPAYVKKTPFSYDDTGFAAFKACTEGTGSGCPVAQFPAPSYARRGTVYVAANDGMLHAFETDANNNPYYQTAGITTAVTSDDAFTGDNSGNGVERWTYVPGMMLPEVYKLANKPYTHRYFVDGSPSVGDICTSTPCAGLNDWRTLLVGGLNSGGSGYYALDVTNPVAPKALWEFSYTVACVSTDALGVPSTTAYGDCNMGLSYGNPIITKVRLSDTDSDGDIDNNDKAKWVVLVTSGYNNTTGSGTGKGYLYILDAVTGAILRRISTGSGTVGSPSGFAKINGWTDNGATDNTTVAVYGGDLNGDLWRINLDPTATDYMKPVKVAQALSSTAAPQPITAKPELGEISGKRVILFGTGQFLQSTDADDTSSQTIYALRDDLAVTTGPVISDVRNTSVVKKREFDTYNAETDSTRTVKAGTAPNWSTEYGWLIDLPESKERVNVDPQLQLGTLVVTSNVPNDDTCTAGGASWVNFLDYTTGSYVSGATGNAASQRISSSLAVGINVIRLPGGKVVTIVTTADNQQLTKDTPVPSSSFTGRRVSWRELVRE
jgi:type IV pilus assembly protein PilY1